MKSNNGMKLVPQIDASSNTDYIFMYYGNPSLEDAQSPQDVWDDDYIGVYHLNSAGTEIYDSSKSQKHGVNSGASLQTGQISNSVYIDGSDAINLGTNAHLPQGNKPISVCAWTTQAAASDGEMFFSAGTENSSDGLFLGSTGNGVWFGTFGSNNHGSTPITFSNNTWVYSCGAYQAGSSNIFLNGSLTDTDSRNYNFRVGNLTIGNDPYPFSGASFRYTGNVDELRISKIRRSDDWINAEYASMNDSLITYGSEEATLNTYTISANLSNMSGYNIDIPYLISGTATASDHDAANNTLSIAAETGTSADINFLITNDQIAELSETIIFDFGTIVNATAGATAQATITINDDEALPSVNFDLATQTIYEGQWWDSNWSNRSKIKIDASSIGSTLEAFPVLVKLNSSRIDYTKTLNNGEDIRFISPDGTEVYPHEIEKWDETGDSFVWVRVPSIEANSDDGYFYLYYNNTGAADAQDTTGVWDEHFNLVMHMNSNTDSTGFGINGVESSVTPSSSNFIGDFRTFSSAASHTDLGFLLNQPTNRDQRSYCAWALGDTSGQTGNYYILGTSHTKTGDNEKWNIYRSSDGLRASVWGSGNEYRHINGTFEVQEWKYFCFTYDGTSAHLYINGITADLTERTNINTGYGNTYISKLFDNSTYGFSGSIDEVRISNIHRGPDWVRAEYLTGIDSFLNYQTEEAYSATTSYELKITSTNESVNNIDIPITVSGTSSNPADHDLSSASLTIPAGQKEIIHIFNVVNDGTAEGDETIIVDIGVPVNAVAGSVASQTITLKDDDKDPILNFSLPAQAVAEAAGLVNIELKLNKIAGSNVTIPYTITGTAANPADHDLADGTATITAGTDSTNISVNIVDDSTDEWGEDITITIGSVTGASLGPINIHRLYIDDNDLAPTISVSSPLAAENAGTIDFVVSLSQASEKDIEFDFATADGTAKSNLPNKNYDASTGDNIVIPAGNTSHTINVTIYDNDYDESDKTIDLTISDLWQVTMGTATGT